MGYFPAPTKPTRILGPDGVPLTGDVSLLPGNNQTMTRAGNALTIVGASSKKPRSVELFVPGGLAARTLLVVEGIAGAVLTSLDAFFKTAPGAGTDVNNFAALNITSPDGHAVSWSFNLQQAEYHLTPDALSLVLGWLGDVDFPGGLGNGDTNRKGMATEFRPTANLVCGGMSFVCSNNVQTGFGAQGPLRVGLASDILSNAGKTVNTTPWLTCADGSPAYVDIPYGSCVPWPFWTTVQFPTSVALAQGTHYRFVVVSLGNDTGLHTSAQGTNHQSGSIVTDTGQNTAVATDNADGGSMNARWDADVFFNPPFKLLGAVVGTPFNMPVTFAVGITGAPANPGADLLVSAQF